MENPHEARRIEQMNVPSDLKARDSGKLMRIGFMSALAIAIHNIPKVLLSRSLSIAQQEAGKRLFVCQRCPDTPNRLAPFWFPGFDAYHERLIMAIMAVSVQLFK